MGRATAKSLPKSSKVSSKRVAETARYGVEKEEEGTVSVRLGPKTFVSSTDMLEYFHKLLHTWSANLDFNKYEEMVLLDLIKRGHPETRKKIGKGIRTFQIRYHPTHKTRCFFILRVDGSTDDFSFRKCVGQLFSLQDDMKSLHKIVGVRNKKRNSRVTESESDV